MARVVQGGIVFRDTQSELLAAAVEHIDFPAVDARAVVPPKGAEGVLFLKGSPPQIGHYDRGNVLLYKDSNQNNNSRLEVQENIGPTKYKIKKL